MRGPPALLQIPEIRVCTLALKMNHHFDHEEGRWQGKKRGAGNARERGKHQKTPCSQKDVEEGKLQLLEIHYRSKMFTALTVAIVAIRVVKTSPLAPRMYTPVPLGQTIPQGNASSPPCYQEILSHPFLSFLFYPLRYEYEYNNTSKNIKPTARQRNANSSYRRVVRARCNTVW